MFRLVPLAILLLLSACASDQREVVLENPVTKQSVNCGFVTAGGADWTDGCVAAYKSSGFVIVSEKPID